MNSHYDDVLGLVRWQRREEYADPQTEIVAEEETTAEEMLSEYTHEFDDILTLEPSPEVQAEIAKLIKPAQTSQSSVLTSVTPQAATLTRKDIPLMLVSKDGVYTGEVAKLLTAMLAAIKFERPQVTTASIITLADKLTEYKPAVIIVFGEDAAQLILNNQHALSSVRNKIHYYGVDNIPLIATYHPASLLKNTAEKRPAWEDLCLLRKHYEQLV